MSHTLLLADDSATIQRVVELAFANEDIDVVTVGDGARAIEAIARDEPDIVLADVSMPGKDGYEVASFVRSDPARARIPVVLLTGAFEPLDEARCGAIGRHEVLVKPFEPRQMIGRVRELLELPAASGAPDAVAAAEALVADRAGAPADVVPDPPPADETGAVSVSDAPAAVVSDASASRQDASVASDRPAAAAVDVSASRADAAAVSGSPAVAASDASASRADASAVSDAPAVVVSDAPASRADDVAPPPDVPVSSVSPSESDTVSSAESDTVSSAESDTVSSAESDTNVAAGSDVETASDPSGRVAPVAGPAVPGAPAHAPQDDPPPARPAGLSAPAPPPGGQGVDHARATGRRDGLSASDPPPPAPPANPGGAVLAQAFATFLAVEQGAAPPAPPAADSGAGPRFEVTDALLDELAERVAARLTETVLRDTVAEVVSRIAGRLVREEGEPVPPAGE